MKRTLLAALTILLGGSESFGQSPSGERDFTFEQVFRSGGGPEVLEILPPIVGWLDDEHYLESRTDRPDTQGKVFLVRASDCVERLYRDYDEIQRDVPSGFEAKGVLASTSDLSGLIFSHQQDLYYYRTKPRLLKRLTANPATEHNPSFSPDGRWVAYTREHDLFAYDLEHSLEYQYTHDGSETVSNGWASWVYYEEILGRQSRHRAFWWSPDSSRVAFMRFDDSPVPLFSIVHADGSHGRLQKQRYPKAGDPNPFVAMGIVTVTGGGLVWADFEDHADHYVAWPFWTPDSATLTVQWMNRDQDTIRLYNVNPNSGKKKVIFEERQPSWVSFFEDLHYLRDGSGFVLRRDIDGYSHLYLHYPNGKLWRRLTRGDWPVRSIERVDEAEGWLYFTGSVAKTWNVQLMRVRLDGSGMETLTSGEGIHRVSVSPAGGYFINTTSTAEKPSTRSLFREDGTRVRHLADSSTRAMARYRWGTVELFTIPADGYALPAYWVLPVEFNRAKKYPVIFNVYGGPGSAQVRNGWLGLRPHYWAQRGIISIGVDHRGSSHFGKKGEARMHRNLGKWEIHDLITAVKWLREKKFVDRDRIGIAGSSYGGYITLMTLAQGADYFKYGQAGSPVTDWALYDTVYTERYMDRPEQNPEGYRNGSVLTWLAGYRGGLRITHGTADDNVHMQNSLQVIDWLTGHDRSFEMMLYPGSRHSIGTRQRPHWSRESHDFWLRNLLDR